MAHRYAPRQGAYPLYRASSFGSEGDHLRYLIMHTCMDGRSLRYYRSGAGLLKVCNGRLRLG
jgi:hypothetical protein